VNSGKLSLQDRTLIAEEILRLRISQILINERYKSGAFKVPIHLSLGHEAIAVAVNHAMTDGDKLLLSHRNAHYNLARGNSLKLEIDEYLLLKSGMSGGMEGSQNLSNISKGIIYTSSVLANNLSVATGVALAEKTVNRGNVTFVVIGDGAMEGGAFYEALEFMRSNRLNTIVIIENNGWSLATQIHERRCPIDIDKFTSGLGIGYQHLSGNDVYQYLEKINHIRDTVVIEKNPFVIEVELTTLGHWELRNEDHPNGKFINYHAGPAPEVKMNDWPVLSSKTDDPLNLLSDHYSVDTLKELSNSILQNLLEELG
jgi:TPP-dependent pyruvate/acetoin dehydrogenase alpha subunit